MQSIKRIFTFYLSLYILFSGFLFGDLPYGITYTQFLTKDRTSIHLLEIDPDYFDIIAKKAHLSPLETVENIAFNENAIAAINGGFFCRTKDHLGSPIGILKIDDVWHGVPQKPRGAIGWCNTHRNVLFDQVLTYESYHHHIYVISQSNPSYTNESDWKSATYIVGGCPLLIRNTKALSDYSSEKTMNSFLYKKHARTAIGILPNGHFVFVVADGKKHYFFSNSGMSIPDLAFFMQSIGCKEALNLDGGGSSTMILDSKIVNTPCGEEYDGKGNYVRSVSDAILVIPKSLSP
jgi:exopolysaccharide biosynthesis protein